MVLHEAEQQINISSPQQQALLSAAKWADSPADTAAEEKAVFEKALRRAISEVYHLLARDSLPRFVKGDAFTAQLEGIGVYDMGTVKGVISDVDEAVRRFLARKGIEKGPSQWLTLSTSTTVKRMAAAEQG